MPLTKHSWGLTALAATSGIGAWLIWKTLHATNAKTKQKHHGSPLNIIVAANKTTMTDASERSTTSTATTLTTCSTLGEEEIKEAWEEGHENINLKILRHLLRGQTSRRKSRKRQNNQYSKLNLFSHLLTRLETTLDEQTRIETKLLRMQQHQPLALPPSTTPIPQQPSSHNNSTVCMVVQRYRGATLLCDEQEIVRVGSNTSVDHTLSMTKPSGGKAYCGLLIYVSFAQGCTQQAVKAASKIVVNLPLLTLGGWGDGSKTMNVIDLAKSHPNAASITIVPQANLINKIKGQGKSIQYHGQIDKEEGNALYHYFVNSIRGLVLEQQCKWRDQPLPDWYAKACSAQTGTTPERVSPAIPPEDLFRTPMYKSWDEKGIPLTDSEDEPMTKSHKRGSARHKRLIEFGTCDTPIRQEQRWGGSTTPRKENQKPSEQSSQQHWATAIDESFVQVVAGSFGKRQSLEFTSCMGPLCHVVQI